MSARCNYCLHGLLIAVNLVALLMANFFCIIISTGGCKNQHEINFQELFFSVALTFTFCNQSFLLVMKTRSDIEEEFAKISAAILQNFIPNSKRNFSHKLTSINGKNDLVLHYRRMQLLIGEKFMIFLRCN